MKKRLAVIASMVGTALALGAFAPSPAQAGGNDYVGCVVVYRLDLGLCIDNPIPSPNDLPR